MKESLSTFLVDLKLDVNSKQIYDLQILLHMKIKVEFQNLNVRRYNVNDANLSDTLPYSCLKCI